MPRTAPPVVSPSRTPQPPSPARRPRPAPVPRPASDDLPPLCNGDRLTQPEFHRRYLAMPQAFRAELIEGTVFVMASPIRFHQHVVPQTFLWRWLTEYAEATLGFAAHANGTLLIDNETEVQPDGFLLLDPARGGQVRVTADDYLTGVPALVFEVAASSAAYDLNAKKRIYARIGVPEYIVATTHERDLHWFVLHDGAYVELEPGDDGIFRSPTWPGLWLPADALWSHDLAAAIAAVQAGTATAEHAAFVAQLTGEPAAGSSGG